MKISYLKEFIALSSEKTYQEAAAQLFVAQSTLSKHIQYLEDDLGAKLFDYDNRKLCLSKFGKVFLPYAIQISTLYDTTLNIAKSFSEQGNLSIGLDMSDSTWITKVFPEFISKYPECHLQCTSTEFAQLETMLLQNKISLICYDTTCTDAPDGFERRAYEHDTLAVILPKGHRFADNSAIAIEQLRNENFIEEHRFATSYNTLQSICKAANFVPNISMTVYRRTSQVEMIRQNLGVAIMAKRVAANLVRQFDDIKTVDLYPAVPLYYTFLYTNACANAYTLKFLEFIDSMFSKYGVSMYDADNVFTAASNYNLTFASMDPHDSASFTPADD